jgi:uncharacterized protein YlxW (UPF0749 family)
MIADEAKEYGLIDEIIPATIYLNAVTVERTLPKFKSEIVEPTEIQTQTINTMTEEEITALQAEKDALQTKVDELTAKLAEYEKKETEAKAINFKIKIVSNPLPTKSSTYFHKN